MRFGPGEVYFGVVQASVRNVAARWAAVYANGQCVDRALKRKSGRTKM